MVFCYPDPYSNSFHEIDLDPGGRNAADLNGSGFATLANMIDHAIFRGHIHQPILIKILIKY